MPVDPQIARELFLHAVGGAGYFAWHAHLTELHRLADQKQREEEARVEKRRDVILSGMAQAMAGNFTGVDKAIDEAIALEADAADVRILRGFAADQKGNSSEAIEHYTEAVNFRRDSVMARAGLTMAYASATDLEKNRNPIAYS
jgi:Flp pilus assembly protein TadD